MQPAGRRYCHFSAGHTDGPERPAGNACAGKRDEAGGIERFGGALYRGLFDMHHIVIPKTHLEGALETPFEGAFFYVLG